MLWFPKGQLIKPLSPCESCTRKILKQEPALSHRGHAEVNHATGGRFIVQPVVQQIYSHPFVLRFHTGMTSILRTPLMA